jgi:carotenoid cleavage dioxygenase-like enzyme
LSKAAVPKRSLFGSPRDTYHDYLRRNGEEVAEYRWSGYVLATLLPYLEEKHQIDLMKSEYDAIATTLTTARQATHFLFTSDLKSKYLDKLNALTVSDEELRDYYNEFNAANESEAGKPMLDGVKTLREALSRVDESSVVLFTIG